MASTSGHGRQCPCKLIPQSLSSFTAAEYGDLTSLARVLKQKKKSKIAEGGGSDGAGYTPLHLAAQHGHSTAVSLLLQFGYPVDITTSSTERTKQGATPLHRASYSGAIAAMTLLLAWKNNDNSDDSGRANLSAKDDSFGDGMTPLHKAISGGRPLAVQLLLGEANKRNELESVLLKSLDSMKRTPLQLARQMIIIATQEGEQQQKALVRRWDVVAGGSADWNACHALVKAAHTQLLRSKQQQCEKPSISFRSDLPPIPDHLWKTTTTMANCLDCQMDENGNCKTILWETALLNSCKRTLQSSCSVALEDEGNNTQTSSKIDILSNPSPNVKPITQTIRQQTLPFCYDNDDNNNKMFDPLSKPNNDPTTPKTTTTTTTKNISFGWKCEICHKDCISLHRIQHHDATSMKRRMFLVCSKCRKSKKNTM